MLSDMRSPLVGADGGMHGYPRDGLPCTSVCLTPATCFSISGDRTGPLGAAVAIWVILAATSPDPSLRLADALAAAEPVDHVLGNRLVKALPMLLRNEYSGKHGGMWGKEKGQYWFRSTTKIEGGKASQRELWSTRKNPGIPAWSHQKQLWHQAQLKKVRMESSKWRANLINRLPPSRWIELKTKGNEKAFDGEIRLFFCRLPRDGWKPEREDLSLRRETARKHQRHSLLAGVSLLQRELPRTERSEKKKRCGSEQARDFFFAISLCFDQKDLILALSLHHFRPRFTSVSLSIWAQSRKLTGNVTNLVDKSTQWIFISNIK